MSKLPSSPRRRKLMAVGFGIVAVPAIMLGFAGAAQAADVVPIAEYVDLLVADTNADLLEIFTTLLS